MTILPQWIKDSSLSTITAGFIAVLVGFTSSVAIIFQVLTAMNASEAVMSSWMWALGLGIGCSSIWLSWWYKIPIATAWSLPGAALLISAIADYSLEQAVGIFIVSSALITLVGITGVFEKFMNRIPRSIGSAMLTGILVNFGMKVFTNLQTNFFLPLVMLVVYLIFKRLFPRFAIVIILVMGIVFCLTQGSLDLCNINVKVAKPNFIWPEFSLLAAISVSLPLFVVTMTSQNIPGVTVIKSFGYHSPTSACVATTGLVGMLLAPFGCFTINLAAVTAAINMTEDVHKDKSRRYTAGIWTGIIYCIIGVFGATVASALSAFPVIFITTLAGIALFSTIANGLTVAMSDELSREPALITFLTTASGVTLWGIGSAFWGITLGLIALFIVSSKTTESS